MKLDIQYKFTIIFICLLFLALFMWYAEYNTPGTWRYVWPKSLIRYENISVHTSFVSSQVDKREFVPPNPSETGNAYMISKFGISRERSVELSVLNNPVKPFFIPVIESAFDRNSYRRAEAKEIEKTSLDYINRVLLADDRLKGEADANATIGFDGEGTRARYVLILRTQKLTYKGPHITVYYIVKLKRSGDSWVITHNVERIQEEYWESGF